MTEKELKRLGRRELIELIAAMKKREIELESRLEKAEKILTDRTIKIANAGSIAEASLSLNGVFEAAQDAADSYLLSAQKMQEEAERTLKLAKREAARILREAECAEAKKGV